MANRYQQRPRSSRRLGIVAPWLVIGPFLLTMTAMFFACDLIDPAPDATINYAPEIDCTDLSDASAAVTIYRCKCASCHGVQGEPMTEEIVDIRGYSFKGQFETALDNGPGTMPEFPELSDVQRTKLFEYVRDSL